MLSKPIYTILSFLLQVPNSQIQIPVQIQEPQHHLLLEQTKEDSENAVSTVVLPSASEGLSILPN